MKKKKKVILNAAIFLIVFLLTVYGVFHGEDMEELKEAMKLFCICANIAAIEKILAERGVYHEGNM